MMNKLKIAFLISSVLSASSSFAAGAAQLTGIKGTLKNVEKAIKSAVSKAEELYEQNGGANLLAEMNLMTAERHPFINRLTIQTDYKIYFTFAGLSALSSASASTTSAQTFANTSAYGLDTTVPVARGLVGTKINLIPIFKTGENVITSWECITNADATMKAFMGSDTSASLNHTSFISTNGNNGTNEYLSNCIYVDTLG